MQHGVNHVGWKLIGDEDLTNLCSILAVWQEVVEANESVFGLGIIVVSEMDILHIFGYVHVHELVLFFDYPTVELNVAIADANLD